MTISVKLNKKFLFDAKTDVNVGSRSVSEQIEHWVKIGCIVEANPDLPYSIIKELLLMQSEVENKKVSRYVRTTKKD